MARNTTNTRPRGISSSLQFDYSGGVLTVKVDARTSVQRRIHVIGDALYWLHARGVNIDSCCLRIEYQDSMAQDAEILQAMGVILRAMVVPPKIIDVTMGQSQVAVACPDFRDDGVAWVKRLEKRRESKLPDIAIDLQNKIGNPAFGWYRTVTGGHLSGRLDGLEVCRVIGRTPRVKIDVGKEGKYGATSGPRDVFLDIRDRQFGGVIPLDLANQARFIQALAASLANRVSQPGHNEHRIESLVLRGHAAVVVDGQQLTPVFGDLPFQFPTRWALNGPPRYVDVLMRSGNRPFVVELKDGKAGINQYVRHAITQAVLYREYLRTAAPLGDWLLEHYGLDAHKCGAVVAFPAQGDQFRAELDLLTTIAGVFDVALMELAV